MTPSKGGRHIIYSKYPEPELLTSYFGHVPWMIGYVTYVLPQGV